MREASKYPVVGFGREPERSCLPASCTTRTLFALIQLPMTRRARITEAMAPPRDYEWICGRRTGHPPRWPRRIHPCGRFDQCEKRTRPPAWVELITTVIAPAL